MIGEYLFCIHTLGNAKSSKLDHTVVEQFPVRFVANLFRDARTMTEVMKAISEGGERKGGGIGLL